MAKSFKIFLMILGLAVFTLPKQMTFAQTVEKCCKLKSAKKNCCKTEEKKPCHKENSPKKSENKNCGNDCASCSSCAMSMVFHTISPEAYTDSSKKIMPKKMNFKHEISFFSSSFHNIWQPPKIA